MKRIGRLMSSALLLFGFTLLGATPALAAVVNCSAGVNAICNSTTATECIVDQAQTFTPFGAGAVQTCTVNLDLHITPTGSINAGTADGLAARTLNLNVAGAIIMDIGAQINGDGTGTTSKGSTLNITATGKVTLNGDGTNGARIHSDSSIAAACGTGGHAGVINLSTTFAPLAPDVSIIVEEGAKVTANGFSSSGASGCPAGDIVIAAPPTGRVTLEGVVESAVDTGSTGNGRREDGGPITIIGGCDLLVTGTVSSRGLDNGADRVHLEAGCTVKITGLVESRGAGHINNPLNLCTPNARPDKPADSTACVEIWSGGTLLIDGPSGAEVRADNSIGSTAVGTSWVDLFAVGQITINGPGAGLAPNATEYVVHANGYGGSSDVSGTVQVKSRDLGVVLNGPALQASALNIGGQGGDVLVEAKRDIDTRAASGTLTDGRVQARGATLGGAPAGGTITFRSFGDAPAAGAILANAASTLDVIGGLGAGNGAVSLTACVDPIQFPPGTIVPAAASAAATKVTGVCGGNPSFQAYVVFPTCLCGSGPNPPPGGGDCVKASVRSILDTADGRFPGNAGVDALVKVHEGQSIQQAVDGITDVNGDGYLIILVVARDNGLLGGVANESINVSRQYPLPFGLLACSVTMVGVAPGHGEPTGLVSTSAGAPLPIKNGVAQPGNIFVMDLHGSASTTAGWQVNGDGRMLRNVNARDNGGDGVQFLGNDNIHHGGRAEDNGGVGFLVQGHGNTLTGVDAFGNQGHGVQVTGDGNTIDDVDSGDRNKGNVGDGINVAGNGNTLNEVSAFANAGNGVSVTGDTNTVVKSDAGEKSKPNGLAGFTVQGSNNTVQENDAFGNGGHGFAVTGNNNLVKNNDAGDASGNGNAGSGFVVNGANNTLDSNRANGNTLDGFNISAGANKLKSNQSNQTAQGGTKENKLCEYRFADGSSLDQNGNKEDNAAFAGTGSPKKYAAGCFE